MKEIDVCAGKTKSVVAGDIIRPAELREGAGYGKAQPCSASNSMTKCQCLRAALWPLTRAAPPPPVFPWLFLTSRGHHKSLGKQVSAPARQ